jgi:hypothetical protein
VSSRHEEKERRRLEREEAERAAASSSARRKRLGLVLGGVLAVAIGVIVALAVASGDDNGAVGAPPTSRRRARPTRPRPRAPPAASCARIPSRAATTPARASGTAATRRPRATTTPRPRWTACTPSPPDLEQSVHALEHGRINVQYKPGTPAATVRLLSSLVENFEVKGTPGYHALLFENQTNMEPAVAATAWTKALTCPTMNDRVYRRDPDVLARERRQGPRVHPLSDLAPISRLRRQLPAWRPMRRSPDPRSQRRSMPQDRGGKIAPARDLRDRCVLTGP